MTDNLEAAIAAGRQSVDARTRTTSIAHPLDPKIQIPLIFNATGEPILDTALIEQLDARYLARPRAGTVRLTEVDSFVAHLKRWGSDATVVYADTAELSLTAVLDDHPAGGEVSSARQHRAVYACPRSAEWVAWTTLDGKAQGQTQFADFIEGRLEDLVGGPGYPAPTELLQVARSLNILTKGTFQREFNPTNGDSIFVCKTETDAKSTQIPRAFLVAIPVFDGGIRYQIEARVRFALQEGRPVFSYTLHRRAEIERDAFGEVRTKVGKETGKLVLAGTP